MGGCCCKCTPRWKNEEDVLCAYLYEECACFRPRKFVLVGCSPESEWDQNATAARDILEQEVFDPNGEPIRIAHETPKGCCGYEMFEATLKKLEMDWCPSMNAKLATYGYEVDAYEWVEMRYISNGQGGHTQPVPHFCIRVKKLGVTDTVRMVDGEEVEMGKKI